MFMFPEPPPLDYYITNVSKSYLSDGIFYHGTAAASHKYIAKQLKPIKRTLRDPVAPPQKLDSRTLNRMLENEKQGYVNPCGKDDGMVYDSLKWMPKWRVDRKPLFSTFPRSLQYELSYIRDRRLKDSAKCQTTGVERVRKEEETIKTNEKACHFLEPPNSWKEESGKASSLPVGNVDDSTFGRGEEGDQRDIKISGRLPMDHSKKCMPSGIHRIKNPEDTGMDVLERADAFEVSLRNCSALPKDSPPVDICICSPEKRLRESKLDQDLPTIRTEACDNDRRWQPSYESTDIFATDAERQKELRKLTRPFLHELHTWYRKNKPTINVTK